MSEFTVKLEPIDTPVRTIGPMQIALRQSGSAEQATEERNRIRDSRKAALDRCLALYPGCQQYVEARGRYIAGQKYVAEQSEALEEARQQLAIFGDNEELEKTVAKIEGQIGSKQKLLAILKEALPKARTEAMHSLRGELSEWQNEMHATASERVKAATEALNSGLAPLLLEYVLANTAKDEVLRPDGDLESLLPPLPPERVSNEAVAVGSRTPGAPGITPAAEIPNGIGGFAAG